MNINFLHSATAEALGWTLLHFTWQGTALAILSGCNSFVQPGLALSRVRDLRVPGPEFDSFEAYCRAKWQYGRQSVNQMVSAAQVFTHWGVFSSQKPENQSQSSP